MPKSRADIAKQNRFKRKKGFGFFKRITSNRKVRKALLIFAGIVMIVLTGVSIWGISVLQAWSKDIPTPESIFDEKLDETTIIYDRYGIESPDKATVLYRLFDNINSDRMNIDEIPEVLKASFLAAEDDDFYNHAGYDLMAIIRCAYNNLRKTDTCGGSTITQQLIKIRSGKAETTIERKVKELFSATKIEEAYKKDEILEMYMRATSFGSNIVGAKTAAKFYFGKEVKDLNLAEAAIIASIVRNPSRLSPTVPYDGDTEKSQVAAKERQLFIFKQMEDKLGKINAQLKKNKGLPDSDPDIITPEMIEEARAFELKYLPPVFADKKAGHFIDYTLDALTSRPYNKGEVFEMGVLKTGGYKIYTSLAYDLQQVAEKYTAKGGADYAYLNMHNAALMTTQPSTGQILTMVGSKNYNAEKSTGCNAQGQRCKFDPQVNVLTSTQSMGSTMKALGFYIAYKEGKIAPGSMLPDVKIKFGGYEPKNWDGKFLGPHYSARDMLRLSRNTTALAVMEMVGVPTYIKTAQSFGYTTLQDDGSLGPSLILGGGDVIPVEHAQAFSVFANGGDLVELDPILKIVDRSGNVIYEAHPERKPVGDPQAAYLLNQTLNRLDSLGTQVYWDNRDIAGKTGTTEENKHALVVMYSPDFVTLAIGGNNNNDPLNQNSGWPGTLVVPWVKSYMSEISKTPFISPKTPFPRPGFVYQGGGDCNDKGECLGVKGDWLIEGREPLRGDFNKIKVKVCKDQQDKLARPIDIAMNMAEEREFLYYLHPVPNWQQFLDDWFKSKGQVNGAPTESCTIDRSGGVTGPFFSTLTGSFSGTNLIITGSAYSTDSNITNITFTLDNVAVPSCTTNQVPDFTVTCDITAMNLDSGSHTLNALADDDKPRNDVKSQNITVSLDSGLSFTALPPTTLYYGNNVGAGCSTGTCQYNISVNNTSGVTFTGGIRIYQKKNNGGGALIGTIPTGTSGTIQWGLAVSNPGGTADTYTFYIQGTTPGGGTFSSVESAVTTVNP